MKDHKCSMFILYEGLKVSIRFLQFAVLFFELKLSQLVEVVSAIKHKYIFLFFIVK